MAKQTASVRVETDISPNDKKRLESIAKQEERSVRNVHALLLKIAMTEIEMNGFPHKSTYS